MRWSPPGCSTASRQRKVALAPSIHGTHSLSRQRHVGVGRGLPAWCIETSCWLPESMLTEKTPISAIRFAVALVSDAQNKSNGGSRLTGVSEFTVMPVGPVSPATALNVTPVVSLRNKVRKSCAIPSFMLPVSVGWALYDRQSYRSGSV